MLRKITEQRIQWDVKLRHGKHRALKEGYLTPCGDWTLVISLCRDSFAAITEFVTKWCPSTWQTAPMEPGLVCVTRGISKSTENRIPVVEWDSFHQLSWPTFWTDNQFSWNNLCSWGQLFFIFCPDLIDGNLHNTERLGCKMLPQKETSPAALSSLFPREN